MNYFTFDLFGKPVLPDSLQLRIPYMGSKNKITKQLFKKMLEMKPKAKYFFDLFGGGGSMSFYALQCGLKVHYNEKQKGMVDLLEYILNRARNGEKSNYGIFPDDFYNFITREEFFKLKNEDSIKGQFARICYSFGNGQKCYLFGDIEYKKHLGHNIVMFKCKKSLDEFNKMNNTNIVLSNKKTWNERRIDYMRQFSREQRDNKEELLEQLERLQQLEQLEQLQQLEQLPNFTITNLDFQDVIINTPSEETIVYLDPPYRGTGQYIEKTLFSVIDNYFINLPYTCFMSEYNAPFNCVFEIEKRATFSKNNNTKIMIEKLFYNNK